MNSDARVPVAQYLRMSSGHQHYSLESQSSAIGMYAESHGFSVIQTYTAVSYTHLDVYKRQIPSRGSGTCLGFSRLLP